MHVKDAITFDNYNTTGSMLDSMGVIKNIIITTDVPTNARFVFDAGGANSAWYNAYAGTNSIDTTKTVAQVAFVNAFPTNLYNTPNFRLLSTSTASAGANFSGPQFPGGFTALTETENTLSSVVVYPNPATQNTTISFTLVENNKVSISVYDVLGNLVSLVSQNNDFAKGNNKVSINTSSLSIVIYYISLEANGSKETKKLVIST